MNNETKREKITTWDKITFWWEDMSGQGQCNKEDQRPMLITGACVVLFNIVFGIFAVSHFLNS